MANLYNSQLLELVYTNAKAMATRVGCSAVTRDFLLAALLESLTIGAEQADENELIRLERLAAPLMRDKEQIERVVEQWRNCTVSLAESMSVSSIKYKAALMARSKSKDVITADILLQVMLSGDEFEGLKLLRTGEQRAEENPDPELDLRSLWASMAEQHRKENEDRPSAQRPERKTAADAHKPQGGRANDKGYDMLEILEISRIMKNELQSKVVGQPQAIATFVSAYFQSELQNSIQEQRKGPRATFLFAGPPGVGKTFLSELAADVIGLPFYRYDMSEYTDDESSCDLAGMNASYKDSKRGILTGFVEENPRCVLLFDEIEKAHLNVIHLFLQVLDAGRLRDNYTEKVVDFSNAILIFTTNAGKNLYEKEEVGNLSATPRNVILDALRKDINPVTREPFFPAAICSRFAAGHVIMFNHLEANSLQQIVEARLNRHAENMRTRMNVAVDIDGSVANAILLAEGAGADARTINGRTDSFFSVEVHELYRLLYAEQSPVKPKELKRIHISVDTDNAPPEVRRLFVPEKQLHAVVYTDRPLQVPEHTAGLPVLHYVSTMEEVQKVMDSEKVEMILCGLPMQKDEQNGYLNREDVISPARTFLNEVLTECQDVPLAVLEYSDCRLMEEEKESFLTRGVRAFVPAEGEEMVQQLRALTRAIFGQNCMMELARASHVLHYETAQQLNEDGESAEILLFDMKLKRAVKAEDAESLSAMISLPDVKFDDVIGAEDAKKELRFFARYMKEPRLYRQRGVEAPKGLLLYGPPGTGKTMLAKAFAAECGAAFIAMEGNKFITNKVGEGAALVHRVFAQARRYAPTVIFVDEIDTVARKRTGLDTDMSHDIEAVLTAFFAEMDGFSTNSSKPVIVLGATNYGVEENDRMTLDPAMLRRFDRRILIDLPGKADRRKLLALQVAGKPIFQLSEEELDSLADRSGGMSPAQLVSMMNMAMRSCLQRDAEFITDTDMEEAFETFKSGDKRSWSQEIMLRTARHEMGHAMVSYLAGDKPSYVTVVSRSDFGGYMRHSDQEDKMAYTRKELLGLIRTAMGGRAAEIAYYGPEDGLTTGASSDLRQATHIALRMLCTYGMEEGFGVAYQDLESPEARARAQQHADQLLKQELANAVQQISAHRDVFDRAVEMLLDKQNLRSDDIDRLFGGMV